MVILIAFIYTRFFRNDLIAQQQQNQSKINNLEQEYRQLYQFRLDLPLYETRKKELATKLVGLLEFLPAKTEMPSLIDEIYKAGYKSNINFSSLTPQNSVVNKYYNTEPISLVTSAGFSNFTSFVQYIGELPRILNIRSFDLNVDQKTLNSLNVQSKLETYIYNQDISRFVDEGGKGPK